MDTTKIVEAYATLASWVHLVTPSEQKVLYWLANNTVLVGKESIRASLDDMVGMSGLYLPVGVTIPTVMGALQSLVERGIVLRQKGTAGRGNAAILQINLDWEPAVSVKRVERRQALYAKQFPQEALEAA